MNRQTPAEPPAAPVRGSESPEAVLVPGTPDYAAYLATLTGPAPTVAHERKAQVRRTQIAAPGECWRCDHYNAPGNRCVILIALRPFCVFHSERQEARRAR